MKLTVIALFAPVQITAALFALGLVRVTGGHTAWVSIAAALSLMALRRIISQWGVLYDELPHAPDPWAKSMALGYLPCKKKTFQPLFRNLP